MLASGCCVVLFTTVLLFSTLLSFHSRIWGFPHFLNLKVTRLSLIDLAVAFPALPTLGCTSLFLLVLGFKRLTCLGRLPFKLWTFSQCLRMSSWVGRTHLINLVSWPPVDFFFFLGGNYLSRDMYFSKHQGSCDTFHGMV